jgi:hypothetical protein
MAMKQNVHIWTLTLSLQQIYAVHVEVVRLSTLEMTLMILILAKEKNAPKPISVKKDFFAETKQIALLTQAGSLSVLYLKLQLTMMAVEWTNTEKLLATGTFPQVTQLRVLGLANTEERQDSGALIPTVIRLESGETLRDLKMELS